MIFSELVLTEGVLCALVLTPTREHAYQVFELPRTVGSSHDLSAALVIGEKDLKFKRTRLAEINIIFCTLGRLLQHMDENAQFDCSNLKMLTIDGADKNLGEKWGSEIQLMQ